MRKQLLILGIFLLMISIVNGEDLEQCSQIPSNYNVYDNFTGSGSLGAHIANFNNVGKYEGHSNGNLTISLGFLQDEADKGNRIKYMNDTVWSVEIDYLMQNSNTQEWHLEVDNNTDSNRLGAIRGIRSGQSDFTYRASSAWNSFSPALNGIAGEIYTFKITVNNTAGTYNAYVIWPANRTILAKALNVPYDSIGSANTIAMYSGNENSTSTGDNLRIYSGINCPALEVEPPAPELDPFVNITGDFMTGSLLINSFINLSAVDGSIRAIGDVVINGLITLYSSNGNIVTPGVITASSFVGSGSQLTGVAHGDSNTSTICTSADQVLLQNGSCKSSAAFFDDTNAETICATGEVLLGDGSCVATSTFLDDTNIDIMVFSTETTHMASDGWIGNAGICSSEYDCQRRIPFDATFTAISCRSETGASGDVANYTLYDDGVATTLNCALVGTETCSSTGSVNVASGSLVSLFMDEISGTITNHQDCTLMYDH